MSLYFKTDLVELYHGDCINFMESTDIKVDKIITSPPYNNSRQHGSMENHEVRYDIHLDNMTNEEYIRWIINIFNHYDNMLNKNGAILFNLSYGSENTTVMSLLIAEIIKQTTFTLADILVWKKPSAIPNNVSPNKMTRIVEFVYVFCRESEFHTFTSNKTVLSQMKNTGQKVYENVFNFFEANNNDYSQNLNKATFSYDFVFNLIDRYVLPTDTVFDSFSGIGTTIKACEMRNIKAYGVELSEKQCEFTKKIFSNGIQKTLF